MEHNEIGNRVRQVRWNIPMAMYTFLVRAHKNAVADAEQEYYRSKIDLQRLRMIQSEETFCLLVLGAALREIEAVRIEKEEAALAAKTLEAEVTGGDQGKPADDGEAQAGGGDIPPPPVCPGPETDLQGQGAPGGGGGSGE